MKAASLTRLGLLPAAFALSACAAGPGRGGTLEGRPIYSESVQMSCADPSGERVFSVRLCQYPQAGLAWIWAAALVDGEVLQFVDNAARWRGQASVAPEAKAARYQAQAPGARVEFQREGALSAPTLTSMQAAFDGTRGAAFTLDARFAPNAGFAGLLPGRTEIFGEATATLTLAGRTIEIAGPGQWHEQPQSDPRFVTSFDYASLWGDGAFATLLETPDGAGGYAICDGATTPFEPARFTAPGPTRTIMAQRADASVETITLNEIAVYWIEIYGRPWRGSFVRGALCGRPIIGFANTWRYP